MDLGSLEDYVLPAATVTAGIAALFFGTRLKEHLRERKEKKLWGKNLENHAQDWIENQLPRLASDLADANIDPEEYFGGRELVLDGAGITDKYFPSNNPTTARERLEFYLGSKPFEKERLFRRLERIYLKKVGNVEV